MLTHTGISEFLDMPVLRFYTVNNMIAQIMEERREAAEEK